KTYLSASGTSHAVQIRTVRENAVTRLVLDIADVAELLRYSEQRFTIAELKMAAEYPFRAPRLFALQQQATAQAKSEYSRDPQVPEDAYRHVLWSYLLTKEFGPEFAELVTDAHEDTAYAEGSGDAQMDLKNNAVGRKYALANLPETLVLSRVRTDPQVIKLEGRHAE
ncbi:MAG TPA: hypothetical protein PLP17_00120, partial [Oligoflexia bacterium]|nr:hypothetical protein [Oligoflexia bacterium]